MDKDLGVVIAAAGTGTRMKSSINKQYMQISSHPVLSYTIDVFDQLDIVKQIILVVNPNDINYCKKEIVEKYGYKKITNIVEGGKERHDSVWSGLNKIFKSLKKVAVHDGARPLLMPSLIEKLVSEADKWGAAIPYTKPKDTLKSIDGDGFVKETLNRATIASIQTPQVFKLEQIIKAYEKAYKNNSFGTDDASLYEKYIGRVKLVESDYTNIKITTPEDIQLAELYLKKIDTDLTD
ncbi:2-C-methyl-D-erythritol 4-phosphate cytidylyltransferase [Candidatus Syntrophocurvum alkaliphilum]|uniref:2-C-methyl-D-erythritol 4-phosphate cytidylyltransferase n=1 Tax=Candidatus Syntrophocurvum alkaliphilum TaxID=2293317 RepID=A0A6I6DNY0_9FIRM|nr:2-C-methyl-D-erythritol 4-phosphate cytidylyltransferase [Candidatus Syntrophocurvum alkaliphilum]QGU00751.1 2-C-methyl-D-erythritol 4-phosphate cytidylyltransferase [Candidatus Syntrophocurvum alkaliphilum]